MSEIGKIVKSNSHIDYICQVYGPNEVTAAPEPEAYAFGSFVAIELDDANANRSDELIAVVYNTQLMNPDYGSYGPRLSNQEDLQVFSPDYLMETATLISLLTVGMISADRPATQGVPRLASRVNAPVRSLIESEFKAFHAAGDGTLSLRYMPTLMAQVNPLIPPLLLAVLDHLDEAFPADHNRISVMRNNLAWRRAVSPMG